MVSNSDNGGTSISFETNRCSATEFRIIGALLVTSTLVLFICKTVVSIMSLVQEG